MKGEKLTTFMGLFNFFRSNKKNADSGEDLNKAETNSSEQKTISETVVVRYSLNWKENIPEDQRKFESQECYDFNQCTICEKLLSLDRYYTRRDIQQMSARLGYSVYDNPGGAVKDGYAICACKWSRNRLVEKKG